MTKIVLDSALSGINISKINENFQKIADEFQDKVLYRSNPIGEPNSLSTDIDLNNKRIFNLPIPTLPSEAARFKDVQDVLATVGIYVTQATTQAVLATAAKVSAEAANTSALATLDSFDDRYLGPKAIAPTLDNDGNPLLVGALYFDTVIGGGAWRAWNGSVWVTAPVANAINVLNTPAGNISSINVQAALNELDVEKAIDTAVVHNTGNESIGGVKTFTSSPIAPTPAQFDNTTAVATMAAVQTANITNILSVTGGVSANALTATLPITRLDFRSTTLNDGTITKRNVLSPISVVAPSGATLGTVNAQQSRICIIAIDNAGTVELALINLAGSNNLDESTIINTTAISAASTASNVFYSTVARTGVAFRVVGYIESTQATAGVWATIPSTVQGVGGRSLAALNSVGFGQTWQLVTRVAGTTYYNTTGKPIVVNSRVTSTVTAAPTISVNGVLVYGASNTTGNNLYLSTIIPPGASYILSSNSGTPTVSDCWELR